MKISLLSFLLVFIISNSLAQIDFEKGYFIDTSNQRTECFIKNIDWENNPTFFQYKLSDDSEIKTTDISFVKEFGINDFSKYVRADVNIDRSPNELEKLSGESKPVFSEEQLFLKVLIEGEASLYYYRDKGIGRFFYNVKGSSIEQLFYKSYLDADNNVRTNKAFRQQLLANVNCKNAPVSSVKYIEYYEDELKKYFRKYNECKESSFVDFSNKKKFDFINFKIAPGIDYSSLYISNGLFSSRDIDFGNKLNFRFGLEAEFILPFNKNKWRIILTPTYQYFNRTVIPPNSFYAINSDPAIAEYKSIEFPIGLRHYFFLNKQSKIFLNALYISNFSIDFNSIIKPDNYRTLNTSSSDSFAFGAGMEFAKFSAEIRYSTKRNILIDYVLWATNYSRVSLILGYALF